MEASFSGLFEFEHIGIDKVFVCHNIMTTAAPPSSATALGFHRFVCYFLIIFATQPAVLWATTKNQHDLDLQLQHASHTHLVVENLILSSDNGQDVSHLSFQPSILDFKDLSVGDADSDVVTVFNKHTNRSVYLGSISGNIPDFYSSFFEDKVIPPLGNTTFNVVFLPRQPGAVETNLQIHTSFGVITYTVRGKGIECLFRLNPLVGLRAPFNATLTPEIYMFNPYGTPLQIVEVYSSGGQFQLELPSGGPEGPQALWEIPPFSSKPVIRVRFTATTPGNHTAYIRIKVSAENNSELSDVVLVVPIEVEIYNQHGIYSEIPFLNFGLGGSEDRPKKLIFKLLNSGQEQINIERYSIDGDADAMAGISLQLNSKYENNVEENTVTATVDWSKVKTDRYFRGNILITTVAENKDFIYKIPFVGEIVKGAIYYNESITKFVTTPKVPKTTRDFVIRNDFEELLVISNVTFPDDASKYFKAVDFKPQYLTPGAKATIFQLSQLGPAAKKPVQKHFVLHTNINDYEIPVASFNGLLRRIVPVDEKTINGQGVDEKTLNFGTLPTAMLSDSVLAFVNDNPVPITIHNWTGTVSPAASFYIILRGCGNLTMDNLKFCYYIQPGEWIVFQVSVLSNAVGSFVGKLTIKTDYEELVTPVKFNTAVGKLEFLANMLDESFCFPGGLCNVNLTAYSTFQQPMTVEEILVNVTGITYDYSNIDFPAIAPNEYTHIGQLQFSPKTICGEDCYVSYPDRWSPAVITASNTKDPQQDLLVGKLEAFRAMKSSFSSILFRVQTSQVRRYDFNGSANLVWPKLVEGPVEFSVVQVGQESVQYVSVHNPTDQPLKAYYMLHEVSQIGAAMTFPPEIMTMCWDCFLTRENVFGFIDAGVRDQHFDYIAPHASSRIGIRFSAQTAGNYATLLYVRNNFTILEAVWMKAKAGIHQFKFGNRKPGSQTPLLFELSDKHLRDCDRKQKPDAPPVMVTAKRTFTARNTGDIAIQIFGMYIGDELCEGYGFRILDCRPFELQPNASTKIEIAFTPDFTLARVTKTLELVTSLNYSVNYTLLSMIPAQALSTCGKALKRPSWEFFIRYIAHTVLAFSFLIILFASYFESEKVLKDHLVNMSKDKGPIQPTLDLRQIGLRNDYEPAVVENGKLSPTSSAKLAAACNGKKKVDKKRNEIDTNNRKSWATVLAKKFSPIKSDVKFRELTPPPLPPPTTSSTSAIKPVESRSNKRNKDFVDFVGQDNSGGGGTKSFIEDDSSSTTTETSTQSNETDPKKSTKCKSTVVEPEIKSKTSKVIVKKTKSLPITSILTPVIPVKELVDISPSVASKSIKTKMANGFASNKQPNNLSPETARKELNDVGKENQNNYIDNSDRSQQIAQKKYGKTPGRERKKADPIGRKNQIVQQQQQPPQQHPKIAATSYKETAFQFTSPLTNSPAAKTNPAQPNPPIWDMKVSFSNVVAQSPNLTKNSSGQINHSSNRSTLLDGHFGKPYSHKFNSACNGLIIDDNVNSLMENTPLEPFTNDLAQASSSSDLGPIGTRKSPSSTPLWEPMPSIQKPIAKTMSPSTTTTTTTVNDNPHSFFSGSFPHYSNHFANELPINNSDADLIGGASGLLDSVYGQHLSQKQRVWDQTLLLTLLQHQQNQQKQEQQQELTKLQSLYSNTNSLWGANFQQPDELWQPQGPIRPPPGLENVRTNSPLHRDRKDKLQQQQQPQQKTELPQFDPFSSLNPLSSIWSTDTWPTNNNNNMSNNSSENNNNNNNGQQ